MIRRASVLLLVAMFYLAAPVFAQQPPPVATPTRQAFQTLVLGMTREMVSKLVSSQGPMDIKQEVWGRWVPGPISGRMEVLRVHFYDNRVFWIEYDAFGESWLREEKGGCGDWMKGPMMRLRESLQVK
ncbi:hypothetical protein CLG94_00390 [Candidatus Methylomirabilis limnetica]|uniref:Lipoprotein SmpA/OmlA domain-containing protein n=1 Tax=Candidatus Methylomirabilis limnetica TaxID=2033718 RepID=A0A2T4U1E1_9BACT|nr:hypothetical protein [Candidatus Methylomirabilis limnetica]PTL37175.1 hypothetical protein CLG94_00390 [Candidatus Methylomirabilis limnetica]